MKLYTKTGDDGSTGLFGGERAQKDDARVEAYGTVDETNTCLGVARALQGTKETGALLESIQSDLFVLGAELACVPGKEDKLRMKLLGAEDIERLEHAIDTAEVGLPELKSFVLPGGTPIASALHHARTVCRRAERSVISARRSSPVRSELVVYLNRLSDLLFCLARRENFAAGVRDIPWNPR
jgi:cob(I)alamin adenosyltransferase